LKATRERRDPLLEIQAEKEERWWHTRGRKRWGSDRGMALKPFRWRGLWILDVKRHWSCRSVC